MINLRQMTNSDIPLFSRWLKMSHVAKWYVNPDDWITEIEQQENEFNWIHHYIAEVNGRAIGFCQYYAGCDSDEKWLEQLKPDGVYSIDYLVGESDALRCGFGKQMIKCLDDKIFCHDDARLIAVQPERENKASIALLCSCGFALTDDENGIYVKRLKR